MYHFGVMYRIESDIVKRLIFGIIPTLGGLILIVMYFNTLDLTYGFMGIPCLALGLILLWLSLRKRNLSMNLASIKTITTKDTVGEKINAITFYARKTDDGKARPVACKFEHRAELTGIQWKSRDWNEYYYINVNIPENGNKPVEDTQLKPIFDVLPDTQYHSPKAVLKAAYLPANTELAKHMNDKELTLSAWILFAVICVEIIGLIIVP